MELVSCYTENQERIKEEMEKLTFDSFKYFPGTYEIISPGDIMLTMDDVVVGRVQSLSIGTTQEPLRIDDTREFTQNFGSSFSGTFEAEYPNDFWDRFATELDRRTFAQFEEFRATENRQERRKKASQRRSEENDAPYRKDIRKMLGGSRRWN